MEETGVILVIGNRKKRKGAQDEKKNYPEEGI